MSLNSEITRLQTAKADIKDAIEEMGGEVGNGTIDTYAAAVRSIPTGGGTTIIAIGDITNIDDESSSSDIFTAFGGESQTAEIINQAKNGNLFLTSKVEENYENGKSTSVLLNASCSKGIDQGDHLTIYFIPNLTSFTSTNNLNDIKVKKFSFTYREGSANTSADIYCDEVREYKFLSESYFINTSIDNLTTSSTSSQIEDVIQLWTIIINEVGLYGRRGNAKNYSFKTATTNSSSFGYYLIDLQLYDLNNYNYQVGIAYLNPANKIVKMVLNYNSDTEVSSVVSKDEISL